MIYIYVILLTLLLITILYLFALMPSMRKVKIFSLDQRRFAHRGLHQSSKYSPENSMAAFSLAIDHGYGIELDVQLTKDCVPIVFHDYDLKRMCGHAYKIADLTYEELQTYTLLDSTERIPSLFDVLSLVNGKVPLIIEYKVEVLDLSVCSYSNDLLKNYTGWYCIESFHPFVLLWYKKNRKDVIRGQLSSNFLKDKLGGNLFLYFIMQYMLLNFITKPDFIAYNHLHSNVLSFLICKKIYRATTFAWTIQSQKALEDSKQIFDYIIFDGFIPN